jgi:hypothetical protein
MGKNTAVASIAIAKPTSANRYNVIDSAFSGNTGLYQNSPSTAAAGYTSVRFTIRCNFATSTTSDNQRIHSDILWHASGANVKRYQASWQHSQLMLLDRLA